MHNVTVAQARAITNEITEAIKPILAKHGLESDVKAKWKYGFMYSFSFEAPVAAAPGEVNTNTREALAYASEASWRGLDPDAVGKTYRINGEDFIFLGVATRARTMPWLFQKVADGKTYKFREGAERYLKVDAK